MNKTFIKTILILLAVMIVIFAIIAVFNLRNNTGDNSGFASSTTYNQVVYSNTTNTTSGNYQIGSKRNPVEEFSKNYTILFIISMVLLVIFLIFYFYLNRKKEW